MTLNHNKLELIETNVLNVAINLGNPVLAYQDKVTEELKGISVVLAKKIAKSLTLKLIMHPYQTAGEVVEATDQKKWDIAFLAIDPKRAQIISFTTPYIKIQGTYMVKKDSSFYSLKDIDQPGVTINVGQGAAYDLFLTRHLKAAQLKRFFSSQEAIRIFLENSEGNVVAGVRDTLSQAIHGISGYRILEESFTEINQAVCTPSSNSELLTCISNFIEQWYTNGDIEHIISTEKNPYL